MGYKILLCCSAGMSTSLLVQKIIDAGKKQGIKVECFAASTDEAKGMVEEWDIIMIGPQVRYLLPYFKENTKVPSVIIEPQHYALAKGEAVLKTAIEIINKRRIHGK